MKYSPANGTEFEIFLRDNCYECKKWDVDMMSDREINKCNILFKLLDQQGLSEKDAPDVYQFADDELDESKGYPPTCLKREEIKK
jgi:hypothetical protein